MILPTERKTDWSFMKLTSGREATNPTAAAITLQLSFTSPKLRGILRHVARCFGHNLGIQDGLVRSIETSMKLVGETSTEQ
jgi:hypothetical protein